ncbi:hypothetical protein V8Z80_13940 [Orrella sp. JC864]|uniref:hypothetical protein n=1 Tax=Orrella sp. JC864 TaxID=3120298 RepID=UPI00142932E0
MGPAADPHWSAYAVAGDRPRAVTALAALAGWAAALALAGLAPAWGQAACMLAACLWSAWLWRGHARPGPARTLRVSACGRHWQLGGADGWQDVQPVARWQTGAWLTLDLAYTGRDIEPATALPNGNIALQKNTWRLLWAGLAGPHGWAGRRPGAARRRRCTLWRSRLAPQAWRRLAWLSAASLARRPAGLEGAA